MIYQEGTPPIVEIRRRYREDVGDDAIASDVLRVTDEMLTIASTLPGDEAKRMIRLVRNLVSELEKNLVHRSNEEN